MIDVPLSILVGRSVVAAVLISTVSGCATSSERRAELARKYSFIEYWPSRAEPGQPRLVVKDIIDMKGVVTTGGSKFLAQNNPPAVRDADCLRIARQRNIPIIGKTNLSEFAMGVTGINDYFGTPRSPLGRGDRVIPGGSSSGSAVAVTYEMADIAFATDTAGSIRIPAAYCGILGLKTTFGLVSLKGVRPLSPKRLDTVGPLARNAHDLAMGMDLLEAGFASKYRRAVAANPTGRSLTVARLHLPGTDPEIERAIDRALSAAGFRVVVLDDTFKSRWDEAQKRASTVAVVDSAVTNRDYRNKPGVSFRTKTSIAAGELDSLTEYGDALKWQPEWRRILERVLARVDFIALPTMRNFPPGIPWLERSAAFEARVLAMQNTAAVNYAGNPAIAIPVPTHEEDTPFASLQLVGRAGDEAKLINAARIVEKSTADPKNVRAPIARNR